MHCVRTFCCQVPRTYDKTIAITNKTRVRDQEEKNKMKKVQGYWTGDKGKPECFAEGKEYPDGLLALPVKCENF